MTLQSIRSCIHTTLILLLLPAMGNISSAQSSTAAQLLDAAQKNDTPTVKKLILAGASPSTHDDSGDSVLSAAIMNKNYELGRWLIARGAAIDPTSMFISDTMSHLPGFSTEQQGWVALLLTTQLTRNGMKLPFADATGRVLFVQRLKKAIIQSMKEQGYERPGLKGWAIRLIAAPKVQGNTFIVACDIASWGDNWMYELASVTGKLFPAPPSLSDVATHAWIAGPVDGPTVRFSLNYDKQSVLNGVFLITVKDAGHTLIAQHAL